MEATSSESTVYAVAALSRAGEGENRQVTSTWHADSICAMMHWASVIGHCA
jgi:hypothetical protein